MGTLHYLKKKYTFIIRRQPVLVIIFYSTSKMQLYCQNSIQGLFIHMDGDVVLLQVDEPYDLYDPFDSAQPSRHSPPFLPSMPFLP